jgi:hypothetical protein
MGLDDIVRLWSDSKHSALYRSSHCNLHNRKFPTFDSFLCFLVLPTPMGLFLLDYGAGNVQSLANTLQRLGRSFKWITSPSDFDDATVGLQFV